MKTEKLLEMKKLLDEGVISQEEFDKEKKQFIKQEKNKKTSQTVGLVLGILFTVFICIGIISSGSGDNETTQDEQGVVENKIPDEYTEEFPITVTGKMYDNVIKMPELSLSFTNNSDKNVLAVQLYFSPVDVYGADVDNIFTTNKLSTDDTIEVGKTSTKAWQMLDASIKAGNVYIYSVYFEDGTEWGNKNAPVSDIKKYGYKLSVKY